MDQIDRLELSSLAMMAFFYSSIGRRAAMMLRRLLSALMMLLPHLSRFESKLNIGVYKTSAPTDRRVKNGM